MVWRKRALPMAVAVVRSASVRVSIFLLLLSTRKLRGARPDLGAGVCSNDREHDIGSPIAWPELAEAEAAKALLASGNLRLATGGIVKQAFDLLGNAGRLAILLNEL